MVMKNIIGIIQAFVIIGLLFICVVFALQLRSSNNSARLNSIPSSTTVSPENAASDTVILEQTASEENEVPDFTTANNNPEEPPEVMEAIGLIAQKQPTGYRVMKDKKNILFMTVQEMALMNVATKEEKQLLSFETWSKNERSNSNVCIPGSTFVDPMFNASETVVYFGAPSQGKDALYRYQLFANEAQLILPVENCISDIAVSPDENHIVYQTTKHFGTGGGYMTDLFLVNTQTKENTVLAQQGVLPQNTLTTANDPADFSPAHVVWTGPSTFFLQGYTGGVFSGVWKYTLQSRKFELITNLKGGP